MRREKKPAAGDHGEHVARRVHVETPGKHAEGASCPRCGATYRSGRWTWKSASGGAAGEECPACKRIAADDPAAVLELRGAFFAAHRDELIARVRHVEEGERAEHPLKRLMAIEDVDGGALVKTTDADLAETMARALESAYGGKLERPGAREKGDEPLRYRWARG